MAAYSSCTRNGVDLIVEVPPAWSVQSADFFAKEGQLEFCNHWIAPFYVFGTDAPEPFDYEAFAHFGRNNQKSSTSFSKRMLLRTKPIHKNACGFCSSLSDFWQRLICLITYWACAMLVKRVSIHHQ